MEASPRTRPSPLVMTYLIPFALLAVVLAVLMDRGRFPTDDRIILIVVIAVASRIYLRDRRLIAAALAFAVASWVLDASGLPEWAEEAYRRAFVEPDMAPVHDLQVEWEREFADRRIGEEVGLYGFVAVNALAFVALLVGARVLRGRGKALHEPAPSG